MEHTKIALISGGTSGIGLAAAQCLSRDGWTTVLLGRDSARGKAAERQISGSHFIACDVTDSEACRRAAAGAAALGEIRAVVTSAGMYTEGLLENTTDEDIGASFRVNVYGTMYLVRAAVPYMKSYGGSIVAVASDAALQGNVQCSVYGAAKGAVVGFIRSVALELSTYGIRANCVCPGDIQTPLLTRQMAAYGGSEEEMAAQYPLRRIGEPQEVGEAIAFLISSKASFITGTALPVDGGLTDW